MTDRICIHCKQPAKRGARMTKDGYLHNGCWDMYFASREGPLDDRSMAAKEVDEGRSELKKPELFTSTTDSGNEDSGESSQQSEKASIGKSFLGILVILIAVGGATLIFMSGQDSSVPQIEGYGGNQNPFVGITNVGIGVIGIFETVMYLIAGGILLVIALVGYRIRRTSQRPWRTVAVICVVPVVLVALSWLSAFLDRPPKSSIEEIYVNGQPGRVETEWHSKGQKKSEITYVNGKREGVAIRWHDDGLKRSETTYVNDQPGVEIRWRQYAPCGHSRRNRDRTRVETEWYRNGQQCSEANYVDGRLEGVQTEWHENGQKKAGENYVNGKPHGVQSLWHFNGQKRSEDIYVNGWRDGVWTNWHSNGQKLSEEIYVDGRLEGVATKWYENGQKSHEQTNVNGNLEGVVTQWYENGQKSHEQTYVNGGLKGVEVGWDAIGQKLYERNW